MISGDSLTNLSGSSPTLTNNNGADKVDEDVVSLFEGIDWSRVNLEELRRDWSQELAQIEQANVKALTEVAEKSQSLLPSLQRAIGELGQVEGVLSEYAGRLRMMGTEIQQIEIINQGLGQQTKNQQVLLEELDNLIDEIDLDDQTIADLKLSLESPGHVTRVEEAALRVHQAATHRFDHGMGRMRAVEERQAQLQKQLTELVVKVGNYLEGRLREAILTKTRRPEQSQASLVEFLGAYSGLIRILALQPGQLQSLKESFGKAMGTGPAEEYREWLEALRARKRNLQSPDPYLFRPSVAASSQLVASKRAFSLIRLGDTVPEDLKPNEGLTGGQLLQMGLLMLVRLCNGLSTCVEEDFEGDAGLLKGLIERYTGSLSKFVDSLVQSDLALSMEMLAVVDEREPAIPPTLLEFWLSLRKRLSEFARAFLQEQVLAINEFKLSTKKRTGVLPFIPLLPSFIRHHEALVDGLAETCNTRQVEMLYSFIRF